MKVPVSIRRTRWELGSENTDDDFHTDVVFLRVSVRHLTRICGVSHDQALLSYRGYRGTFYYDAASTRRLCTVLIERLKHDRRWSEWLLSEILRRSDLLFNVFDRPLGAGRRSLLAAYARQLHAQTSLYEVCWIPEILQAEGVGLTAYLHRYLDSRLGQRADANRAFIALTLDVDGTGALLLDRRLLALAERVVRSRHLAAMFRQPLRYLRLALPPTISRELLSLAREYGFLAYHGYSDRRVEGTDDMLARLCGLVRDPDARTALRNAAGNRRALTAERRECIRSLRIDDVHRRLFLLEGRFATLKLRRRLAQLKNFHHLDRLLGTLAGLLDVAESVVRFMLPEEIVQHVANRRRVSPSITRRREAMLYYIDHSVERIFTSAEAIGFGDGLLPAVAEGISYLQGRPASSGTAAGRAVVAHRKEDAIAAGFERGDILVTIEGDTDLIELLRVAGGLVTDQGGATCHLASIARDFGLPAVIGTSFATRWLKTGDAVYVDAMEGRVEKLPPLRRSGSRHRIDGETT